MGLGEREEKLRTHLIKEILVCGERMDTFVKELSEGALRAFEWGAGAISSAATMKISQEILGHLDPDTKATIENLEEHILERVLCHASHAEGSSGSMHRIVAREWLVAETEMLKTVQMFR